MSKMIFYMILFFKARLDTLCMDVIGALVVLNVLFVMT